MYSPDNTYLFIYYAHAHDHLSLYQDEIASIANPIMDQDYNIATNIWFDATSCDDDVGGCTLQNWKNCKNAGFLSIHSHGLCDIFSCVYTLTHSVAEEWIDEETNMIAVTITEEWLCEGELVPRTSVRVDKQWVFDNWRNDLSINNAIVIVNSCLSACGEPSFLAQCGGRVGFGYPNLSYPYNRIINNENLLCRMNGNFGNGQYREASAAYNAMPKLDDFTIVKIPDTYVTLCPATADYYPGNGAVVGNSGTGYVEVDTYCNAFIPADEALEFSCTGNVDIYNKHWVDVNFDEYNRIEFSWNGSGDFSVDVQVHHDKFQSWGLDYSEYHCLDWDGVAPNTEDGQFAFFSESAPFPPEAEFSSNIQIIAPGEYVCFYDESTGEPDTWEWSFDPSNIIYLSGTSSGSENPVVEFTTQGYYNVTLTVSNANGSDTEIKYDYISVSNSTIQAIFSPTNPQIQEGGYVQFNDASIGDITSWEWLFEGGSPDYYSGHYPGIVSYLDYGVYNVSLTVSDGFNTDTESGQVEVYSDDFFIVHLYVEPNPTYAFCYVYFTCDVLGGSGNFTYNWYFYGGDIMTTSTNDPAASHIYSNPGTYLTRVEVHDWDNNITFPSYNVSVTIIEEPELTSCFYLNGYTIQRGEQFKVYDCSAPNAFIYSWHIYWDWDNNTPITKRWDPWTYVTHTYDEVGGYSINMKVTINDPFTVDWFSKNVNVVVCNNGLVEKCDFSDLTSGPNLPVVAQELVIGGDCPPGVIPEIPAGARVGFYAPDGIRFLDGFHVVADEDSYFRAAPLCPVNNEGDNKDNSLVVNNFSNKASGNVHQNFAYSNTNQEINNNGFSIFPNPTKSTLDIYLNNNLSEPINIELNDIFGNILLKRTNLIGVHFELDLSPYPKGIYLLKIKQGDKIFIEKIIKQ